MTAKLPKLLARGYWGSNYRTVCTRESYRRCQAEQREGRVRTCKSCQPCEVRAVKDGRK